MDDIRGVTLSLSLDGPFRGPTVQIFRRPEELKLAFDSHLHLPLECGPDAPGVLVSVGPSFLNAVLVVGATRQTDLVTVRYRLLPIPRLPLASLESGRWLQSVLDGSEECGSPYHLVRLEGLQATDRIRFVREYEQVVLGHVEVDRRGVLIVQEAPYSRMSEPCGQLRVQRGTFWGSVPHSWESPFLAASQGRVPLRLDVPGQEEPPLGSVTYRVRGVAAAAALARHEGRPVRILGVARRSLEGYDLVPSQATLLHEGRDIFATRDDPRTASPFPLAEGPRAA